MARVLNKRTDEIPAEAVYIGRPSKWGNPFRLARDAGEAERAACIRRYALNLSEDLQEAAKRELRGKDLVCWCSPLPCHGDVLLDVANREDV